MENVNINQEKRNTNIGRRFGIPSDAAWKSVFITESTVDISKQVGKYPTPNMLKFMLCCPLTLDESFRVNQPILEQQKQMFADLKASLKQTRLDCVETRTDVKDINEKESLLISKLENITEKLGILSLQRGPSPENTSRKESKKEDKLLLKLSDVEKKMNKIWSDYNKTGSKPSTQEIILDNSEIKELTLHCKNMNTTLDATNSVCLDMTENMEKQDSKQEGYFKKIEDDFVTISATNRACLRELRELQSSSEARANRQNNMNNKILAELKNIKNMLFPDNSQVNYK